MPGEKMSDEFAHYGEGRPEPQKATETPYPKFRVGEKTTHWGPVDQQNDDFMLALERGLVDRNGCLTQAGVDALTAHKIGGGLQAVPDIVPRTLTLRYSVGSITREWGVPDDFNDAANEALSHGWIDARGGITKEGVEELEKRQKASPVSIRPPTEAPQGDSQPVRFAVSGGAQAEKKPEINVGLKGLLDQLHEIVDGRGYKITDIQLVELRGSEFGATPHYELRIDFFDPGRRGGDGKKKRRNLKIAGSPEDLVRVVEQQDLVLPTTNKMRGAKKR